MHAKLLGKSLNFHCLKCADINAEEEHKFKTRNNILQIIGA